jgi:signal transduction histidine kinase
MSVHTGIDRNLGSVSEKVGRSVYRILQEALTNSCRHGRADLVDVAMAWHADSGEILLRVSDDGSGADGFKIGNGLRGIRERVNELKGEVVFQTKMHQGFDIGITIPWSRHYGDE